MYYFIVFSNLVCSCFTYYSDPLSIKKAKHGDRGQIMVCNIVFTSEMFYFKKIIINGFVTSLQHVSLVRFLM